MPVNLKLWQKMPLYYHCCVHLYNVSQNWLYNGKDFVVLRAIMWIGLPLMTFDFYNIKHDESESGMLHFDSCIQMPGDGLTGIVDFVCNS
jgi:hypothetical protein